MLFDLGGNCTGLLPWGPVIVSRILLDGWLTSSSSPFPLVRPSVTLPSTVWLNQQWFRRDHASPLPACCTEVLTPQSWIRVAHPSSQSELGQRATVPFWPSMPQNKAQRKHEWPILRHFCSSVFLSFASSNYRDGEYFSITFLLVFPLESRQRLGGDYCPVSGKTVVTDSSWLGDWFVHGG